MGVEVLTLYEGERVGPRDAARVVDESALVVVVGLHDLAHTAAVLVRRVVSLVRGGGHDLDPCVEWTAQHHVAVRYTDPAISSIGICFQLGV